MLILNDLGLRGCLTAVPSRSVSDRWHFFRVPLSVCGDDLPAERCQVHGVSSLGTDQQLTADGVFKLADPQGDEGRVKSERLGRDRQGRVVDDCREAAQPVPSSGPGENRAQEARCGGGLSERGPALLEAGAAARPQGEGPPRRCRHHRVQTDQCSWLGSLRRGLRCLARHRVRTPVADRHRSRDPCDDSHAPPSHRHDHTRPWAEAPSHLPTYQSRMCRCVEDEHPYSPP